MTAFERTGWRDQELSKRHRMWGFNCPCVDLDFLVAEYHIGKPVGIIDYKHFKAQEPDLRHPTYRALTSLSDGYCDGSLPFLIAFYWPNIWAFRIIPVNECAHKHFYRDEMLTEKEYVMRLYHLRSLVLTESIMRNLNGVLPAKEVA